MDHVKFKEPCVSVWGWSHHLVLINSEFQCWIKCCSKFLQSYSLLDIMVQPDADISQCQGGPWWSSNGLWQADTRSTDTFNWYDSASDETISALTLTDSCAWPLAIEMWCLIKIRVFCWTLELLINCIFASWENDFKWIFFLLFLSAFKNPYCVESAEVKALVVTWIMNRNPVK